MSARFSLEEKLNRAVLGDAVITAAIAKGVSDRFGSEGLLVMQKAVEAEYRKIVPRLAAEVGVKVGEGDIADWARVEDFLSELLGFEHEFELSPSRGLIRIKTCPMARQYARIFPGFCQQVLIGVERAIASTINPRLEAGTTGKYLPQGDGCCEITCQFKTTK